MKTNIFIVDDYNIFRSGLKLILEKQENFHVVGEALNPKDLFDSIDTLQPDVIVLNLTLPSMHILAITKRLYKKYPKIPFIILTYGAAEFLILECVIHGARGILWKENTPEQLIAAIKTVLAGERFLNIPESKMTSKIIEHAHNNHFKNHDFAELSEREQEVLKLFAEGYSYKYIADKLNISPRTVESHKNNILIKLELESIVDMVKYAIKHDLIEL